MVCPRASFCVGNVAAGALPAFAPLVGPLPSSERAWVRQAEVLGLSGVRLELLPAHHVARPSPRRQARAQPRLDALLLRAAGRRPHAYPHANPHAHPRAYPHAYPHVCPHAYPRACPRAYPRACPQPPQSPQSPQLPQQPAFPCRVSGQALNLPTCACLLLRVTGTPDDAVRPYTPISEEARRGSFDLLVKRYAG